MARITIIDDDAEQAADVASVLGSAGHQTEIVTRVSGAAEHLVQNKPDLLILDVMFPKNPSAGMELAIEIRGKDELKGLPVILLTGVNQEFPLNLSNKDIDPNWMPVQEILEKPIDGHSLLKKVEELVGK